MTQEWRADRESRRYGSRSIMAPFDSHMHTPLCRHAYGHPQEYAEAALERGLSGIIFTCHSPMPDEWFHHVRMAPEDFDQYVELVERTRDEFEERLEIRLGLESDWFPGMENYLADLHEQAEFHFILGSVHYHGPEYRELFKDLSTQEFYAEYFNQLALSAESELFDSLAHPDLVKNHHHEDWNVDDQKEAIAKALDRIAQTGVAMELNTSGVNKRAAEMNPSLSMLAMMNERDIPVTLGSDSHVPDRVGDGFFQALDDLEEAGYSKVQVFCERRPEPVTIRRFRRALVE